MFNYFQSLIEEHRYQIYCVSGITFIRYTRYRKIGMPNNFKMLGSNKPKVLNRIAKIS
jgi:hypothetical protein